MRQKDFKEKQKRVFKIVMMAMVLSGILSFSSCKDEAAKLASGNDGNGGKVDSTVSCQTWDGTNICLQMQGTGSGASATPTLSFKGLDRTNGGVQLYSNSECSNMIGNPVIATTSTVLVTTPAQKTFSAEYYAQYTHTDNTISPCLGPVSWKVEEKSSLALSSENFSSLTFDISGLIVLGGSVQLFSDSACATPASDPVDANQTNLSIDANALTRYGSFEFYFQHTDPTDEAGDCIGSINHDFVSGLQNTPPTFSLHSENAAIMDSDPTPSFSLTSLEFESGKIQLFSDETCTTVASGEEDYSYSSSGATVTANALDGSGDYRYWVKVTEGIENQSRCIGPVAYTMETLTLALSAPTSPLNSAPTPTFSVSGLVAQNGNVQLFSDSSCTTAASATVTVSSGTASITANALSAESHQFYIRHTDTNSNQGDCFGPVAYTMETLTLALSAPTSTLNSAPTPTFSVSGLVAQNGNVQLFSDSSCTTAASATVTVSSGTASITANALSAGSHQFYIQHTDSNSNKGDCFGPSAYTMEALILALSSPTTSPALDTTPTFSVSGLVLHNGTVQLFSDSACTTAASATVAISSATASITANSLTTASNQFYVQHTDSNSNKGDCFGPVAYTMETLTLALSSPTSPLNSDPTPTFSVSRLVLHNGTVQLFSDSSCTTTASGTVAVSSGTASITANALSAGSHQFYIQHTDSSSNKGNCFGPVAYSMETLTMVLSSPRNPLGADNTPTFRVRGLVVQNGTVQLFSDSACSTTASSTVAVDSQTANITASTLSNGSYNFYVQHVDSSGTKGDCTGPVVYSMETLTLTLSSPSTSLGTDDTPTFSVTGFVNQNGWVQLFNDSTCSTSASSRVTVSSVAASITTRTLTPGSYQFYVQHTDSGRKKGDCFGPVAYTMETLALALSSPTSPLNSDSTPTFSVSGFVVQNGNIQLFSDSTCTTAASTTAAVSSGTASITANALTAGNHQFYIQHTDSSSNKGDCFGPVAYTMEVLALSSAASLTATPTLSVSGLVAHNGTVQLFSDSACTTAASTTAAVSSGTASITANTLAAGSHQFYVQHTDTNSNKGGCFGPVAYTMEALTLALSSPATSSALDTTPTFSVSGLVVHNGTVQLFSDSACTTAASSTVTVSSAAASITANALSAGKHQFYVQHTDTNSNQGDCFGPVAYTMEALTLALSSPTSPLSSDSTPTFSVSGLIVQNGNVQLFSDSSCTTAASSTVTVSSAAASITANALSAGNHQFYVQHTDTNSNQGDCFGPVAYTMEALTLALSSPTSPLSSDSTPTFSVSGLIVQNGNVQLFSDSSCTTAASSTVTVSSATASITANALNPREYHFYVQHTDTDSNKGGCFGSVNYRYFELQTSAGDSHTCAVTSSGGVKCWGFSSSGRLGNDDTSSTDAPVDVVDGDGSSTPLANISQISVGSYHTCALTTSGGVKCWGDGDYGQLGNDDTSNTDVPVDVVDRDGSSTPLANISQISSGRSHTCALTTSGGVKCWGYGYSGQLGNDGTADKDAPVDVVDGDGSSTPLANISQISAGSSHTCALTTSGGVKCWGRGYSGELGNDDDTSTDAPVDVVDGNRSSTPLANISQISAGSSHTCALTTSGGVKCWGSGRNGRLGNDDTDSTDAPVDVVDEDGGSGTLTGISQISAGADHTCAVTSAGGVKCWGEGGLGELGNDGTADKDAPVDVVDEDGGSGTLAGIVQVSAGSPHTCAVTSSGGVKCWGRGRNGQLGNDDTGNTDAPVAVVDGDGSSTPLANISQTSAGISHTCALTTSGGVKCWGHGSYGQLGNDGAFYEYPVAVVDGDGSSTPLANISQISAGSSHTCALTTSGGVKCWGSGTFGRLGNDGTSSTDAPVDVVDEDGGSGTLAGIVQVSAGDSYTCALTSTGGVKCWGLGSNGRLGNDGTSSTDAPVDVVDGDGSSTPLANISQISVGSYHTCAVTSSGGVKCWGNGSSGQLGNDGTSSTDAPVDVVDGDGNSTPLANISQISAGSHHTCALTTSGGVKCWGNGSSGQLGNDSTSSTDAPVDVVDGDGNSTPLANISQISAGRHYTCALTTSGGVKCWGSGSSGQLGNDDTSSKDAPVDVVDGDGSSTPLANISQISSGGSIFGSHTCAVTSSGGVKCWGSGSFGRLGNDGTGDTDAPVDVVASDGSDSLLDLTP